MESVGNVGTLKNRMHCLDESTLEDLSAGQGKNSKGFDSGRRTTKLDYLYRRTSKNMASGRKQTIRQISNNWRDNSQR